ncbi:multidrug effflux MFS transporter [Legionella sp. W05-934-2]|jgi:Bcr/CflA subfamily drug resistance transporter|uniref:multidrug effflux MFS transporter n=1 Tax=Legionella sp. W05-934-2 TaxID=1198649 RepID=UPI00346266BF
MVQPYPRLLFVILFLTTVEQFAVDLYLPSLPAMTNYFGAPASYLQQTLTLYLFGFGLSPLLFGPLSDRYGRRPIVLFNLGLYLAASLLCALATEIHWLLAGRLVNGIASGGIVVATSAMSRDSYRGKALIAVSAYMSMVWSLVPIIAPTIGGYIQHYLGWRANFYLIFLYPLPMILYLFATLPETNPNPTTRLAVSRVISRYMHFLNDRFFIIHVLATAVTFAATIAFNTAAPFLFQDTLHLNAVQFGWLSFAVALSYLIGTIANSYLLRYFSIATLLKIGQTIMVSASLVMLIIGFLGTMTVATLGIPASLIILGEGFIYPNSAALAFNNVKKHLGIATALYGSIQLITCSVASALVAIFPESNQIPLALFLLGLSLVLVLSFRTLDDPSGNVDRVFVESASKYWRVE